METLGFLFIVICIFVFIKDREKRKNSAKFHEEDLKLRVLPEYSDFCSRHPALPSNDRIEFFAREKGCERYYLHYLADQHLERLRASEERRSKISSFFQERGKEILQKYSTITDGDAFDLFLGWLRNEIQSNFSFERAEHDECIECLVNMCEKITNDVTEKSLKIIKEKTISEKDEAVAAYYSEDWEGYRANFLQSLVDGCTPTDFKGSILIDANDSELAMEYDELIDNLVDAQLDGTDSNVSFEREWSLTPGTRGGYVAGEQGGLRAIKTARTVGEINGAADAGFLPIVKPVLPNPEVHDMCAVFQDPETGRIEVSIDGRMPGKGKMVMEYTKYYQYSFPSPYAAYLAPRDLEVGEEVWLDDVIEDVVAVYGNQGFRPRLESCAAVWTGSQFQILFNSASDTDEWIG